MTSRMSKKSTSSKTGEEFSKRKEMCARHEGVTLCGNPDDVKKILSLLESKGSEKESLLHSDVGNSATDSPDGAGDITTRSTPSEDSEVNVVASPEADDDCDCQCCISAAGRKRKIAGAGET